MTDLTLIIPAKNEKDSLPKVLDELRKLNFKKNIILEASDKLTIEAIKHMIVKSSTKTLKVMVMH